MVGMFGALGVFDELGKQITEISRWSPYGTVQRILFDAMDPKRWNQRTTTALFVTIGYAVVFTFLGIKWFRWNSK